MGFLDELFRMMQSRPVLEALSEPEGGSGFAAPSVPQAAEILAAIVTEGTGHKIIPEVLITRCESRIDNSGMEVIAQITNQSSVEIKLDKIVIAESSVQLDRFFAPGEVRKLRIYQGAVVTSDASHVAKLYYRLAKNGDCFRADFTIKYSYDSRGFYRIEELRPIYPIRKI